jgi:predicted dehydrogenase
MAENNQMAEQASLQPVRLVVAGAGVIGQAHIQRILQEPEAELVGIVDIAAKAAEQAAALQVAHSTDLESMLETTRPDGVVIALPNQAHFTAGMMAVRTGVAMLMEKPVCETVEQALDLADAAEAATVPVLVGHHRRHSPTMRGAKEILCSGRLGRIVSVNALCWFYKPASYFEGANGWRREPGGGPVMINLIHTIDDLRNLCGEIDTVQAMVSNRVRGFAVEDTAAVIVGFRSGAIGTLALSDTAASPWSWELTSGENPAYWQTGESCYQLAGTKGALSIPRLEFWGHGEDGHWCTPIHAEPCGSPGQPGDPLSHQMRHFCDVARRQAQPLLDARGAAQTLRVTLAVQASARTGQVVRLS